MSTNHSLNDQEKINNVIQLIKRNMITLRINCLHEVELVPKGMFDWENIWYLFGEWDISENDIQLFNQLLVELHRNGIVLAKHIETN